MDARTRLAGVRAALSLRMVGEPLPVTSHSNDTWLLRTRDVGDAVLRVCHLGDPARLLREAAVGAAAPAEVGYPAVLGSGSLVLDDSPLSWTLTRRLSGSTLAQAWPGLTSEERADALAQVEDRLSALHDWRPPDDVAALLAAPEPSLNAVEIVGSTLLPLPLERALALVDDACARAPGHAGLIIRAAERLEAQAHLLPELDDPSGRVLHGDLHLHNVWWDGRRVSGLLDLEWVRFGPQWCELARVRDNALSGDPLARAHARLLASLGRSLPAPDVPELEVRLTVVQLAFQIRQLMIWPDPGLEPAVDHPVRVIDRLLGERS